MLNALDGRHAVPRSPGLPCSYPSKVVVIFAGHQSHRLNDASPSATPTQRNSLADISVIGFGVAGLDDGINCGLAVFSFGYDVGLD